MGLLNYMDKLCCFPQVRLLLTAVLLRDFATSAEISLLYRLRHKFLVINI